MKNLYLVSQGVNSTYDNYDSFVVCCDTEEEARMTHPEGYLASIQDGVPNANGHKEWWRDRSWVRRDQLDKVKVEYLGKASGLLPTGVVCSSFNAG